MKQPYSLIAAVMPHGACIARLHTTSCISKVVVFPVHILNVWMCMKRLHGNNKPSVQCTIIAVVTFVDVISTCFCSPG